MKLTKEQALKKIEELKAFVEWKEDVIMVPDSIGIWAWGDATSIWICNPAKQCLVYWTHENAYFVIKTSTIKAKLVKVDKPKAWKLYYQTDEDLEDSNLEDIENYVICLWKDSFVSWQDSYGKGYDAIINDYEFENRYEVVPL